MSLTILLMGICTILNAQEELEECTVPHQRGYDRVAFYLKHSQFKDFRTQAGTTNIPVEQISHVDNPVDCKRITAILRKNPEFKAILEEKDGTPRFYYQTNDFYYVTWRRLEFTIGSSSVFIVINKVTEKTQLLHF